MDSLRRERPGMDYYDITSPVIKFDSLQLLLAIANTLNWEIEMMDVIGAYLNLELEEEIYMKQPKGFNDGSGRVLKLHCAIYGLKQVGRAWYNHLCKTLLNLRYIQSITDECLYIQKGESGINIIAAYVDDLGLVSNTKTRMAKVKQELNTKLPMTDLGEMKKILGLKVERNREEGTLRISQGPYIDTILMCFHMQNTYPALTPFNISTKLDIPLEINDGPRTDAPYAQAIGSLMYAALGTCPNIAFATQHLSQFTNSYGPEHWTAIKHILCYLIGTWDDGILFRKEAGLELWIYVDADYANRSDAKSISRYVAMLGGGSIAWSARKQRTVSLSTTEAKYIALTEGAKELIWLRNTLQELGFDQS